MKHNPIVKHWKYTQLKLGLHTYAILKVQNKQENMNTWNLIEKDLCVTYLRTFAFKIQIQIQGALFEY